MAIKFEPLNKVHFPLLLKWLETPHVKKWWDKDISWTKDLIQKKYTPYTKGYKTINGDPKPIQAYIIYMFENAIGYLQFYNTYDFMKVQLLKKMPKFLASIDMFVGEEEYLGKGMGVKALKSFIKEILPKKYTHVLVDPDENNLPAIKAYEKAGFKKIGGNLMIHYIEPSEK